MTPRTPADSLAEAASALVREHDVSDLLERLVRDAARQADGDAAGLLARPSGGVPLEVLTATDHAAAHLEIYQARVDEGPCVDVWTTGLPVVAAGRAEILDRWPTAGRAILDAGFAHVHAYPLAWRGRVLGGLNIFGRGSRAPDEECVRIAHAFADMLTLLVAQPANVPDDEIDLRLGQALGARVVVEQAKGVLAQTLGIDMAKAYEVLLERRDRSGATLTETGHRIIAEAQVR
ncbi:GAF and ANTAR domain-containing protein [Isoptericola sp. NEAU-Y5]|uniref:GAF and ANTAR domain-containing protein n=1 Tax=Isoptericola luteus TaxID=2879484 RepID=A0ABS7ZHQ6_9MICO|nr:GAF and ANTAR domain-containing protein [Isoptericola sp. NEAU-Y5]MCA5893997.1 GAF and ANTAR domain-containing protein [Isoptericola sp. NEAU-Y5]